MPKGRNVKKMQVNSDVMAELILDAGQERAERAKNYTKKGKVSITDIDYYDENNFEQIGRAHV